ncbi:MAG: FHA domain-containing protein [Candidatus Ventricola sp.]
MARNNYYPTASIPDDQFAPGYVSNVAPVHRAYPQDTVGPTQPAPDPYLAALHQDETIGFEEPAPRQEADECLSTQVDTGSDSAHSFSLVVGWLVCTKGAAIGQDYRLHVGWNYIGRESSLEVCLTDPKISRRMAKISYDPESRTFGVAPSEGAKSLCYLNNAPLRGDRDMNAYDRLRLGDTELILIPLCSDQFNWDAEKK